MEEAGQFWEQPIADHFCGLQRGRKSMSAAEKQLILKSEFCFSQQFAESKSNDNEESQSHPWEGGLCKNKHTFIFQVGTLRSQLFIDDDSEDNVFK